jgi:hypothetical protein
MKTLAISILMASSVFLAKADIITVKTYTVKHFTHIMGISTKQAIDSGCMNYLKRQVGENTFIFDFDKKTLVINGKAPCEIIDVKDSEDLLDCTVLDNGVKVIYILGDSGEDDYRFLSEWEWEGKVNGYYSIASTKDFSFTVENEFRHLVDYDHFNHRLLERLLFEELNRYRDSLGIGDLLWSDAIYRYVTCKQTDIIVKGSALYHPDLNAVFTDEFKIALAKESEKLTGIKSAYNCSAYSVSSLSENAYARYLGEVSYEQIAKRAIHAWDQSTEGHREAQRAPYLTDGGGKGFVAFSARVNNAKTKVFIFCDFSMVYKERTDSD